MGKSRYKTFIFENYNLDYGSGELKLEYSYDGERKYIERVFFDMPDNRRSIDKQVVDALCFYVFIVAGSSYYKSFVAPKFELKQEIDYWQADFFNLIYSGGLSQFVYENNLKKTDIAKFSGENISSSVAKDYEGHGVLLMQSGGRDSLLAAELMKQAGDEFTIWHMSSTGRASSVLDMIGAPLVVNKRIIDLEAIKKDIASGGYNSHVPFSAIYAGFALIQAALLNFNIAIASNEASADEANVIIDGYKINHQFSKTYQVEQAIEEYLRRYVSPDIHYGSILRPLNELQVAKLFAKHGWKKYKDHYSSCNLANYKQGQDGQEMRWDGTCPKCANTFLVMAPYVKYDDLVGLFGGKNLLATPELTELFRQLMGKSDIKPFECVGTIEELRKAYQLAVKKDKRYKNPQIQVEDADVDMRDLGDYQDFFDEFLNYRKLVQKL